ncbi:MAG: hypothetical protein ACK4K1_09050 [Flavobacterium sp.]
MKKHFLWIAATTLLVACSTEETTENPNVTNDWVGFQTQSDFVTESDDNMAMELVHENGLAGKGTSNELLAVPSCAVVSVNNPGPGQFPKVVTVNFGTGCTFQRVTRSGVLTITLSGPLYTPGSSLTIERSNYFVNNRQILGTVVRQNTTQTPGIPQWTRSVTGGQIIYPNGATFSFSGTRTIQLIEGFGTPTMVDNVYKTVSGTRTVTRPNNTTLTVTVVQPLIKKFICAHISQGQVSLVGTNVNGILDYGDNTCDNQATFTNQQGQTTTITLP